MSEALLLVGGERSPEVRHELAVGPPDPVIWLERDGAATTWTSSLDVTLIADAGGVEDVRSLDELGMSALRPKLALPDLFAELTRRALDGVTRARVPGIDAGGFEQAAQAAKEGCPVSKVLTGAEITLDAQLES